MFVEEAACKKSVVPLSAWRAACFLSRDGQLPADGVGTEAISWSQCMLAPGAYGGREGKVALEH